MSVRWWSALAAVVLSAGSAVAADPPPNIVFVLADDLGWTDLGCQGSKYYETPNIDKLAKDGMRFTSAYAACPVCSPILGKRRAMRRRVSVSGTSVAAGNSRPTNDGKRNRHRLSQLANHHRCRHPNQVTERDVEISCDSIS